MVAAGREPQGASGVTIKSIVTPFASLPKGTALESTSPKANLNLQDELWCHGCVIGFSLSKDLKGLT